MTQEDLDRCRAELDKIDTELIRLMSRRLETGLDAARIKRDLGMPITDPGRESKVIDQARAWALSADLSQDEVEEIFTRLIALSRNSQLGSR